MKPLDQLIDVRLLAPLATSIAIIVSIILWKLNQRRKQLSYRILWQDALTRARSSVRQRLDVTFDGQSVKDAGLVIVQILNSGHLPITPGDIQAKLHINLGPGAKVLYADLASTSPGDLDERCRTASGERKSLVESFSGNEVILAPVLLNEGDSFTVQMLVENLQGGVKVVGHINGIRRITPYRMSSGISTVFTNVGALIMCAAMLFCEPAQILDYGLAEALPAVLFFLFGYTLLSAGIYSKSKQTAAATNLGPIG